jgi:(p)ppGpp synthase/HD superfamily hydrolase
MAFMTTPPTARFAEAVAWAIELHGSQMRKGTTVPYLTHLLAVSALVWENGGAEDDAIAGLLHDAIEDTDATAADIEERFGPEVAAIVLACSDTTVRPKPPWRERKEAYHAHLDDPTTPTGVLRVSAADKLHNARSMLADYREVGDELWARFNAGVDDQLWNYGCLADIFGRRFPGPLTRELVRTVDALRAEVASAAT